jgi:hypothetical protein
MVINLPATLGMNVCRFASAKEEQVRSWLRGRLATARGRGRAIVFICKWHAWYFVLRHRTPKFGLLDAFRYGLWLAQG